MKDKNYYIEILEHRIIDHNDFWEDPISSTQLRNNTEESISLLRAYFNVLLTLEKQYDKLGLDKTDYNKYPENIRSTIKGIIDIINDGRDLWTPKVYKNCKTSDIGFIDDEKDRIYDRTCENGHLSFENNPWDEVNWCYNYLDELEEIILSEKSTKDFKKYIDGKWRYFEGYENGSMSVRFIKINKNKSGEYTFDGDIINWATVDSHFDGNGIIIQEECTDVLFSDLPYCQDDPFENDEDLCSFLDDFFGESRKTETNEEIKERAQDIINFYLGEIL